MLASICQGSLPAVTSIIQTFALGLLINVGAAQSQGNSAKKEKTFEDYFKTDSLETLLPVVIAAGLCVILIIVFIILCCKYQSCRSVPDVLKDRNPPQGYMQFNPYAQTDGYFEAESTRIHNDTSNVLCPGEALRSSIAPEDDDGPVVIPAGQNVVFRASKKYGKTVEVTSSQPDTADSQPMRREQSSFPYFPISMPDSPGDASNDGLTVMDPVIHPGGRDGSMKANPLFVAHVPGTEAIDALAAALAEESEESTDKPVKTSSQRRTAEPYATVLPSMPAISAGTNQGGSAPTADEEPQYASVDAVGEEPSSSTRGKTEVHYHRLHAAANAQSTAPASSNPAKPDVAYDVLSSAKATPVAVHRGDSTMRIMSQYDNVVLLANPTGEASNNDGPLAAKPHVDAMGTPKRGESSINGASPATRPHEYSMVTPKSQRASMKSAKKPEGTQSSFKAASDTSDPIQGEDQTVPGLTGQANATASSNGVLPTNAAVSARRRPSENQMGNLDMLLSAMVSAAEQ